MALTAVRTSTAHLALRAVLHPVLTRPLVILCRRSSLPLRALRRRLFSPLLVDIGTVDTRNCDPHLRTPHRRHPSFARPTKCRRSENGIIFARAHCQFLAGSSTRGSSFARAAGCVLARGVRGECVRAGLTCRSPAMMSRAAAIALAALCILAPGAPPSKPTAPLSPQF